MKKDTLCSSKLFDGVPRTLSILPEDHKEMIHLHDCAIVCSM